MKNKDLKHTLELFGEYKFKEILSSLKFELINIINNKEHN